jgi:uncharacterized protein YbjT (DUF2867 family)
MRVLITGGTGVIGEGVIPVLLGKGHTVRLLTRGAEKDAEEWPQGVEPFAADVSDAVSLKGAADDCEAVVHITGIISESPPRVTFEGVNVRGTSNVLEEAERAGIGRFIYVSSLGADRGRSLYHESKRRAEEHVRRFSGAWVILRPGSVYGPGDEVISTLLKLIRVSPVVPVIDGGEQRFQPIWFEDMGAAVAAALENTEASSQTLELAGRELTTMNDIIDRLSGITGRTPGRLPIPAFIASLGTGLFEGSSLGEGIKRVLGIDAPVDEAKLTMLLEENFIREPERNDLIDILGVEPLSLDVGLKALADLLPEQSMTEGVGDVEHKRFHADIVGSRYNAAELLEEFRALCMEIMPLEFSAEPGAESVVAKGATLTASIPLRGHIQVRVAELTARRITFVTLEGHPLAGVVQFKTSALKSGRVRFMIEIHARHASLLDSLTMSAGGSLMQDMNWQEVVSRVVEISGGTAPDGVKSETETLDEAEAERAERKIEELLKGYRRSVKAAQNGVAGNGQAAASGRPERARKTETSAKGRPRRQGSKKNSDEAEDAVEGTFNDTVETVSQAASSLVESVSEAARKISRAAVKSDARSRTRR